MYVKSKPPHIILGINKNSTIKEIKKKYYELLSQLKDKENNKYYNKQFSIIKSAYDIMISPSYQEKKDINYQRGIFYPKRKNMVTRRNRQIPRCNHQNCNQQPRVLCNGTVLLSGGLHPSKLNYETLQNLRRNHGT